MASTLKMQIRTVQHAQGDENKVSGYGYGLWCGFKWGTHHAAYIIEVSLKIKTKEYLDVVIAWCNQVAGGRPWVWQQDSALAHKSKVTQAWLQKEYYDFLLFSYWPPPPRPEPAGLLRLFIRREHQQHDLPQYQSQPDRRHPPSIRRAPAGTCGKACSKFRISTEVVIEAEGSYIE